MRPLRLFAALVLALGAFAPSARAQLYDQADLAALLYARTDSLETLPEVTYRYFVLADTSGMDNSIRARHDLYKTAGNGDAAAGRRRLGMTEFFNRIRSNNLALGDTLILPSHLELDHRAYAPFPRFYAGAASFDKLFVIHKGAQAWAAYERGRLARWGLVNTGGPESRTPAGRFNFNWREPERVSTLSPPGERWLMRWVFNLHHERGIHVHQYNVPTGAPGSHGCVRLIMADAQWIYNWADGWVTSAGPSERGLASADGRVLRQGTVALILGEGEEPTGPVQRFTHTDAGPALRVVELPADPYSVPAGTEQQRMFDRQRTASAASAPAATPARAARGRDGRVGR